MSDDITPWEDMRELLAIPDYPVSEEEKAEVRDIYYTRLSVMAKVGFNDYFLTLEKDAQERIKEFWGFSREENLYPKGDTMDPDMKNLLDEVAHILDGANMLLMREQPLTYEDLTCLRDACNDSAQAVQSVRDTLKMRGSQEKHGL